jgi:hypothetical protein
MNSRNTTPALVQRVLGHCVWMGFALVFVWSGAFFAIRGVIERQGQWFGLSPHEVDVVAYGGLGFAKVLLLLFFVFPYFAVRLALRARKP